MARRVRGAVTSSSTTPGRGTSDGGSSATPEFTKRSWRTGNAATTCRLDFVQEQVRAFRERADAANVSLVDAMHYGMEKPPQLAMADWFRARGLDAQFVPDGPR